MPDPIPNDGKLDPGLDATQAIPISEASSTVIGHYHLLQKIGEGGMGEVWLAEQKEPVRRRVALKLVKAGMNTREVISRFESERQALALMDHPAIAKVLDAGSTPQGAPYFVMEYVAGISITDFCDRHRLNTRERLELFVHVCEGVQHAHQKAIIHRDLKPSNILVTEVDGRPAPKIIDFGVAKALTQRLNADTLYTRMGALLGTPEYMSPEQALSAGEDIDTRTDVYSLGIIFYELLAGVTPLDLRKVAFDEFLRKLRDDDAPKPSTRLRTQDKATSADIAQKRRSEPVALAKQVRGDLDSIALKALEKERSRRYGSPSEFAADIARYLNNEPVRAVAATPSYRARKFAYRYRAALATVAGFILVLMAAAGVSIWQSIRATRQRDRADTEAATARAVNQFLLEDLLSQASSSDQSGDTKPDADVKVRTLLDRAAAQVGKRFADRPLVEAAIQHTIGSTYYNLALWPEAEQHLRRAYELDRRYRGVDALDTIDILQDLSAALSDEGKAVDAQNMMKTVVELNTRKRGPEDTQTLKAMQNLGVGYLLDQQYAQAEPLLKKALEIQSRRFGYDNKDTLNTSDSLAILYISQAKYADAGALLTKGLESYRRIYGPDHPFTQREMYGLGRVMLGEGNYAEAEKLTAQVYEGSLRMKGDRNPETLVVASRLGQIYAAEGKFAEAASLLEKAVEGLRATLGPGIPMTLGAEGQLAAAYDSHGDLARAEQIWRRMLAEDRRQGPGAEADLSNYREMLGQNLTKQHRYGDAESLLRQAIAYRQKTDATSWTYFRAQAFLGANLAAQKKYVEAEPLLLSGYEGMKNAARLPATQKQWVRLSADQLVNLYTQWSKPEQAAQWRAKLQTQ